MHIGSTVVVDSDYCSDIVPVGRANFIALLRLSILIYFDRPRPFPVGKVTILDLFPMSFPDKAPRLAHF